MYIKVCVLFIQSIIYAIYTYFGIYVSVVHESINVRDMIVYFYLYMLEYIAYNKVLKV